MNQVVAHFNKVHMKKERDRISDFTFNFMKGKSYEIYANPANGMILRELLFGNVPDSGKATVCTKVSVMLSDLSPYVEMTTKQVIAYFASIFNIGSEEASEISQKILENSACRRTQLGHCSEDHKKMIALEISLMDKPEILVLDSVQTFGVEDRLSEYVKSGGCLIIINQDSDIEYLSDVVISL